MSERKRLTAADLELTEGTSGAAPTSLREAREGLEREMIQQALKRHDWKISAAATSLGISRPTLYELMEKLGVKKPEQEEA
jgi:two-component system NtrC family response regulator